MVTREDAEKLMKDVMPTRQAVTARIAEVFDPTGLWGPVKLQLKLHLSKLNGRDWKKLLSPEEQDFWKE